MIAVNGEASLESTMAVAWQTQKRGFGRVGGKADVITSEDVGDILNEADDDDDDDDDVADDNIRVTARLSRARRALLWSWALWAQPSIETRRRITTYLIRSNMIYIVGADCGVSCPEDT